MIVTVDVDRCSICPYYREYAFLENDYGFCSKMQKDLEEYDIPNWCPYKGD